MRRSEAIRVDINSDPYLNPKNCTDVTDIDNTILRIRMVETKRGGSSRDLDRLLNRFFIKKLNLLGFHGKTAVYYYINNFL